VDHEGEFLEFPDKAPLWGWIVSMVVVIPAAWRGGFISARSAQSSMPA